MKQIYSAAAVLVLLLAGCGEKVGPGAVEVKRPEVRGVTLATVGPAPVDSFYETSGTVKAKTTSVIASRTMGTVTSVKVKGGARVKAGDLLLVLDDREASQRVAAAEAGYREAQKALETAAQDKSLAEITRERYQNLYQEKAVTRQEMDQIETQGKVAGLNEERAKETVRRAKALLEEARIHEGFTRIRAVEAGVVTEKRIEEGSLATPGIPLMTLEDTSGFRLEAYVDERLSGQVPVGTPVVVVFEALARRLPGAVDEVLPAIDPTTRTFLVKIGLRDPLLKSGLFGRVLIPEGRKQVLLVPRGAVVEKGQLTGAYVVDDQGIMTYRLLKRGRPYGEQVEVLSGLKAGERIVVGGLGQAVDGGIVKQK
jgi:RND family efflux transporter MFP subunit